MPRCASVRKLFSGRSAVTRSSVDRDAVHAWLCGSGGSERPAARAVGRGEGNDSRSEEHTSELQSLRHLVCPLLLEKKIEPRWACRTIPPLATAHSPTFALAPL